MLVPVAVFADSPTAKPTNLTGLYVLAGMALALSLVALVMALRNRGNHSSMDSDEF